VTRSAWSLVTPTPSDSYDKTVRVWDALTRAELNVLMGHAMAVNSVAISRDAMRIVSGSGDKTVRIWDLSTGAELNVFWPNQL